MTDWFFRHNNLGIMALTAGQQLANARAEKALSKEAAARLLGISTRHYYNLEAGKTLHTNPLLARRIEREFGISFPSHSNRSAA